MNPPEKDWKADMEKESMNGKSQQVATISRKAESPGTVRNPSESRRSHRVRIAIPVLVRGNKDSVEPLKEMAQTSVVNATGGSILLKTNVAIGQKLLLFNMKSEEEITCTVASLLQEIEGKMAVGIVFDRPSPRFWGLGFPPEDWDPADRKRPGQSRSLK
jgi:hypothetical protein